MLTKENAVQGKILVRKAKEIVRMMKNAVET